VLLEIRHVTRYEYVQPVRESVMEVWMQPQKSARQRLVSFDLDLDPPAQVFSYPDTFGNAVYHFDVPQPHDRLTITARSAVETEVPPEIPARLDMGEWDRLASDSLRGDNFDYLHAHGFARGSPELDAFINGMGLSDYKHRDPLSAVRALSELIYGAFAYETGVTRADSPIEDVLRAGKGVCQDFAHLMIAVCRGWGLPAVRLPLHRPPPPRSIRPGRLSRLGRGLPPQPALGGDRSDQQHLRHGTPCHLRGRPRLPRRAALARSLQGRHRQPALGRRVGSPRPRRAQRP
jgi:hypothetical protein